VLQQPHELLYCDPGGADKTSEQTAVKLLMVKNREMPAVRTIVNHVAGPLVIGTKTTLEEHSRTIAATNRAWRIAFSLTW
jgi:hypothetical protein